MAMRRGLGTYIIALVAVAAMLMLVSLYAELRQDLAHYAKLAREDVESAREEVSIEFNSTSSTIDVVSSSMPSRATAVILVSDGRAYVHRLPDPMPLHRGARINLSSVPLYSELKQEGKRVDRVCILTENLNLFCTDRDRDSVYAALLENVERVEREITSLRTLVQNTIEKEVAKVRNSVLKEVVQVYRSSRLLPLLASMMNEYDYLSITSRYIPVDSAVITIPKQYRYLMFSMSYRVGEDSVRYTATLYDSDYRVLARSSGTIVPERQGKYVDVLRFEKTLVKGSLKLTISVDVEYFVKKGIVYARDAVALVPLIRVEYRIEPRDSELYLLSFWSKNQFTALTSACDPRYTPICRGFAGSWFEGRLSVEGKVPYMRSHVVSAPRLLGSKGDYVYVLSRALVFRYRYAESWNVDTDLGAWIFTGTWSRDTICIYVPWPPDYSSYSSLVFLVESTG